MLLSPWWKCFKAQADVIWPTPQVGRRPAEDNIQQSASRRCSTCGRALGDDEACHSLPVRTSTNNEAWLANCARILANNSRSWSVIPPQPCNSANHWLKEFGTLPFTGWKLRNPGAELVTWKSAEPAPLRPRGFELCLREFVKSSWETGSAVKCAGRLFEHSACPTNKSDNVITAATMHLSLVCLAKVL